MLRPTTRRQLVAFVIVAVTTVGYAAFAYLDLPKLLGIGYRPLTVALAEGGDIYPQSVVTLRGVPVGQVTDVRPTVTGAVAELTVRDSAEIPVDSPVQVRSVSAAGEQYLNFEPAGREGPFLEAGDEVPVERVSIPVDNATLLGDVQALVSSVPPGSLETSVDELSAAFSGTSADLQRLTDSIRPLQDAFTEGLDPTVSLLDQLGPVLDTQRDVSPEIRSFAQDLAGFTGQVAQSDAQLRGTLNQVPGLADETVALLGKLDTPLPVLLANLTSVGQVLRTYNPAIAHTLTLLPATSNGLQSALNSSPQPGAISLHLKAAINDPPACTQGFLQDRRDPSDVSPTAPPTSVGCAVPHDSPQAVRGSHNYPCPDDPARRASSAAECGLQFQDPAEVAEVQREALDTQVRVSEDNPKTAAEDGDKPEGTPNTGIDEPGADLLSYDAGTGLVFPDESGPFMVGRIGSAPAPLAWQRFLLTPLGIPAP